MKGKNNKLVFVNANQPRAKGGSAVQPCSHSRARQGTQTVSNVPRNAFCPEGNILKDCEEGRKMEMSLTHQLSLLDLLCV